MKDSTLQKMCPPLERVGAVVLFEGDLNNGVLKAGDQYFQINKGIPCMLAGHYDKVTSKSFSSEWEELKLEDDVWGRPVEERMSELKMLEMPLEQLQGKDFLDVGCGNGLFARTVALKYKANVIGLDISTGPKHIKNRISADETIDFIQADARYAPFKEESFDIIWCAGSLHHTPNPRETFAKLVPLLKQGGRIFVWLYTMEGHRNFKFWFRNIVKEMVCRMPKLLQDLAVYLIGIFTLIKHTIIVKVLRKKLHVPYVATLRHHRHMARDAFTVRYDWHLSKEEILQWHKENALKTIDVKYVSESDGIWLAGLAQK